MASEVDPKRNFGTKIFLIKIKSCYEISNLLVRTIGAFVYCFEAPPTLARTNLSCSKICLLRAFLTDQKVL